MIRYFAALLAALASVFALSFTPAYAGDDDCKGHDCECPEPKGSAHPDDDCPEPEPPPVPVPVPDLFNVIVGSISVDRLPGGPLRDAIFGLDSNDRLLGRGNDDMLFGGRGRDVLRAGSGEDVLRGGPGRDRCFGDNTDRFISCERVFVLQ